MFKSGLIIFFERAIKDYISEEGLEQLTIFKWILRPILKAKDKGC